MLHNIVYDSYSGKVKEKGTNFQWNSSFVEAYHFILFIIMSIVNFKLKRFQI